MSTVRNFSVVQGLPPNIDAIASVFPRALDEGVIFAYGDTIYVNGKMPLSEALKAHECVHLRQQADIGGPEVWWFRYLTDKQFCFEQELEAHLVEYAHICREVTQRNLRRLHRDAIAKRLSGPLYGYLVTFDKAKSYLRAVQGAIKEQQQNVH